MAVVKRRHRAVGNLMIVGLLRSIYLLVSLRVGGVIVLTRILGRYT